MRILVVSARFPPANTMGSITVQNMTEALSSAGHDVRVITISGGPYDQETATDHRDTDRVSEVWRCRMLLPASWLPGNVNSNLARDSSLVTAKRTQHQGFLRRSLIRILRTLRWTLQPDPYILWAIPAFAHFALRARRFRPQFIIASGPPHSSLLLGNALSKICRAEFVPQFRDLWADNPYWEFGPIQTITARHMEAWVLRSAGLVVVSTEAAKAAVLHQYPQLPTFVWRPHVPSSTVKAVVSELESPYDESILTVVHAGSLCSGLRDPWPLLASISSTHLRIERPNRARFVFLGDNPFEIDYEGTSHSLVDIEVVYLGKVDHLTSLRMVFHADIFLVLLWPDEKNAHTIPGKVYEAAALGVPTLVFGRSSSEIKKVLEAANIECCITHDWGEAGEFISRQAMKVRERCIRPSGDLLLAQSEDFLKLLSARSV